MREYFSLSPEGIGDDSGSPYQVLQHLTDNGKRFNCKLFGQRKQAGTEKPQFDELSISVEIENSLTPTKCPPANGMVERFNGRIEKVLQSHHFRSGEKLDATLHLHVWLYNQKRPQSALGSKPPLRAMKKLHIMLAFLLKKKPYLPQGCGN